MNLKLISPSVSCVHMDLGSKGAGGAPAIPRKYVQRAQLTQNLKEKYCLLFLIFMNLFRFKPICFLNVLNL